MSSKPAKYRKTHWKWGGKCLKVFELNIFWKYFSLFYTQWNQRASESHTELSVSHLSSLPSMTEQVPWLRNCAPSGLSSWEQRFMVHERTEGHSCSATCRVHTDGIGSLSPTLMTEDGWLCRAQIKHIAKSSYSRIEEFCWDQELGFQHHRIFTYNVSWNSHGGSQDLFQLPLPSFPGGWTYQLTFYHQG